MSLRERILGKGLASAEVEVKDWDTTVTVRQLSALDRIEFEEWEDSPIANQKLDRVAKLVILATYDADGTRLFTKEDLPKFTGMAWEPLILIAEKVTELSLGGSEKNA